MDQDSNLERDSNGLEKNISKEIIKKYTDIKNPGSFTSANTFVKNNPQYKLNQTYEALSEVPSYTLHKNILKKFNRRKTIVSKANHTWQIDLADVSNLKNKKFSQFYNFIFIAIDSFSRYAYAVPLKNKSSEETSRALEAILKNGNKVDFLYGDNGKEFMGKFREFANKNNIRVIFTKSTNKASIAERFIRTLKQRLYRYFTFSKEKNYINVLDKVINNYNNSYHGSIKMKPSEVNKKNEKKVYENLYGNNEDIINNFIHYSFNIGDYVRRVVQKNLFEKGYTQNWTSEIYIVSMIIPTNPPTYNIKSTDNVTINQFFYKEQLQKVKPDQFPYDTLRVYKENNNQLLVSKLNSENNEKFWIDKESKNDKTSDSNSNEQKKEENKRILRSATKNK